jgi:hypothetical protein
MSLPGKVLGDLREIWFRLLGHVLIKLTAESPGSRRVCRTLWMIVGWNPLSFRCPWALAFVTVT